MISKGQADLCTPPPPRAYWEEWPLCKSREWMQSGLNRQLCGQLLDVTGLLGCRVTGLLHGTFHLPSQHAHQLLSGQYRLWVNRTVAWHKQIALGLGIMGTWTASDSGMKPMGEKCTRKKLILSSGTELHPPQHQRHPSPPWNSCWDQAEPWPVQRKTG